MVVSLFDRDKVNCSALDANCAALRAGWAAGVSLLALACASAFTAGAARAQDANQVPSGQTPAQAAGAQPQTVPAAGPTNTPSPASTSSVVQEVVVTAERRAVNIQTTAISMSAISGAQLQEKQVVRIADLESQTPGLSITNSGLTQNVNIRGLGNTTISPAVTTGVPVFRDGLYEPEAILLNEPFYDIADVEVLRGPQGTIIGQNSTGGALTITSRNPNFDGINGYVEATGGSYSDRRVDGAVNLPILQDVLAARLAFNIEDRNSFFNDVGQNLSVGSSSSNDHPGQVDAKNVRIGILWKPSESFQALFKAELNYLNTGGYTGRPLPPPVCNLPGCSSAASYYQYGYNGPSVYNGNRTLGPYDLDYNHPVSDVQRADRYSLELRQKLADGITIRSLTGYQHMNEQRSDDNDASYTPPGATPTGFYDFHTIGPLDDYYSEEVDVLSPDQGRFTWLFGGSYFYRTTPVHIGQYPDVAGVVPNAFNPEGAGSSQIVDLTSIQRLAGMFGQASFEILPNLQLQVGARYSLDSNQGGGEVLVPIPGAYLHISQDGHYSKNVPTGKVALNWTPIPGQFFYAFVARGYKEGGVNGHVPGGANSPIIPNFNPEYVNDYEGGWKGRLFDGHLQTQLGGYYMQYDALQQQVLNTATGQNYLVNLGNSTIYGLEASAQGKFGPLSVDFGLAYNHSSLGAVTAVANYELPGQGSGNTGPGVSAACPTCFNYAPYEVSLSGEANPYSPTLTANVTVSYSIPLGPGTLTPRGSFSYTGQQYASIFQNSNYYLLDVRHLVDGFLSYTVGDWEGELFVRNLTNQVYLGGISAANQAYYADPRTYGVRVQRSF